MGTEISQGKGRLYRIGSEQYVAAINYQLHEDLSTEPSRWWGEFTFADSVGIRDSDRYIIELDDGRKGMCYLKKLVNRAVSGMVPPRYVYHFTGISPLD